MRGESLFCGKTRRRNKEKREKTRKRDDVFSMERKEKKGPTKRKQETNNKNDASEKC